MKRLVFLLLISSVLYAQENFKPEKIDNPEEFSYELLMQKHNEFNYDFFSKKEDAILYAKFLINLKFKKLNLSLFEFDAYDAGENWMITAYKRISKKKNGKKITDTLDGGTEFRIIFNKDSGKVIRFIQY